MKKNTEANAPIRMGRVEDHVVPDVGITTGGTSSANTTVSNSFDGSGSHSIGGTRTDATTSNAAKGGGSGSACTSVLSPPAAGRSFQPSLADSRR